MGYRLEVRMVGKTKPRFYGTKVFGYIEEKKLKSYRWLVKNGFLKRNENYEWYFYCDNPNDHPIVMHVKEFKEFAKLYNDDHDKKALYPHEKDCFINDSEIKKFLKLEDHKLVVISWG